MIFITGDTHGSIDISKLNSKCFPIQRKLTKKDIVIICGDFGCVWYPSEHKNYKQDLYWRKWLRNRNFTTLFVDGNHENFELLNKLPEKHFCGGKVGVVDDGIYHLKRGEIYTIEGKRFFCFGGARSHDKMYRKEGISWWSEEIANMTEMNKAIDNLSLVSDSVDYIITHCCSTSIVSQIVPYCEEDAMTRFFEYVDGNINYRHWFFGHYHVDVEIDEKHTCLYQHIINIC